MKKIIRKRNLTFSKQLLLFILTFLFISTAQARASVGESTNFELFQDKKGNAVGHFIINPSTADATERSIFSSPDKANRTNLHSSEAFAFNQYMSWAGTVNLPPEVSTPQGASCETMVFQASRSFAVGQKPQSVATGDFNNDGAPDLVVANSLDFSVPVFLNDGNGGFKFANSYFLSGGSASGVAVGDFNNDGFMDFVVVTARDLSLLVFLGNGDGSFKNPLGAFDTGGKANTIAVGDLNGDGNLDLIASLYLINKVSVLLGNGSGLFQQVGTYPVGSNPVSVILRDVNSDAKTDAVVVNQGSDNISVLLGNGSGILQPSAVIQVGDSPKAVAFGHFDSDNHIDLVAANSGSQDYSLVLGNGDGSFGTISNRTLGIALSSITSGDFNQDGKQDIAVSASHFETNPTTGQRSEYHSVRILSNDGAGTFESSNQYSVGEKPMSLLSQDFNRDGRIDLASANNDGGTVSILLANSSSGMTSAPYYMVGTRPEGIAAGDFNNDGTLDIAVANSESDDVSVLISRGDGTFNNAVNYRIGRFPGGIAVGDLNNDGKQDLAVLLRISGSIAVLLGNGDGTFNPNPIIRTGIGSNPEAIIITELNNDGNKDIAFADPSSDYVQTLLGNGDGSLNFSSRVRIGCGLRSLVAADFNRDGIVDLAVSSACTHKVAILLGNGDGSIRLIGNITVDPSPNSIATGDFNHDSIIDIAVVSRGGDIKSVSVLIGNGDGAFSLTASYSVGNVFGAAPWAITVGDFNSDGKDDLAVTRNFGNDILILKGIGNGTFIQSDGYGVRSHPRSLVSGDFNADGKLDIAVVNYLSHDISILLQSCLTPPAPTISANTINRTAGDPLVTSQIATVDDAIDAEESLSITVNGGSSATSNGVTVSNIQVAYDGSVTADIIADCGATDASFTIGVTNSGNITTTATLTVNVSTNPAPVLGNYPSAGVINIGAGTIVTPDTPPSDNVAISSVSVNSESFVGNLSVNATTGIVSVSNASPAGSYVITVMAIDNCGAYTTRSFGLIVNGAPTITGQNISRQRGDTGIVSTVAQVGDDLTAAGNLTVSLGAIPLGVTISNVTNNNGTISATVEADCFAALGNNFVPIQVTDGGGLMMSGGLTVNVIANPSPSVTIMSPQNGAAYQIGSIVSFGGSFADNTGDIHKGQWSFSSTNISISQAGTIDEINKSVSASYTFNSPGIYSISLAITDKCGNTGMANTVNNTQQARIVVFDPNAGSVKGNGSIDSPAGAYRANTNLTGKVKFKFGSEYQNGANLPIGNTELQFKAANFDFNSTNYDWLLISGAKAQYQGSGTINGNGSFGFILTVIDGQVTGGGGVDKLRMKIWNKSNGAIIYDNQVNGDTGDNANPTTAIDGGNIIISR